MHNELHAHVLQYGIYTIWKFDIWFSIRNLLIFPEANASQQVL